MPAVARPLLVLLVSSLVATACAGSPADGPGAAPGGTSEDATAPQPGTSGLPLCPAGDFPWESGAGSACEPVTAAGFDYDEIISGGPPPDGIPPIDDPRFDDQAAGDLWLADVSPVMAVSIGGEARAYPLGILTWHEIVNDVVSGVPIAVTYCPLCNSGLVFDRRVDDDVLDFGTSGRLYRSNLVMYDRQTRTLWSQFSGTALWGDRT